jgi:peptidoglycan/LPS O-acetylase OafA/YrhL
MTWAIRSYVLAAGAAALLSAQAVYAAPTPTASSGVDPLVSLSVLGTQQSRAALCSATASATACGVPASMASASAATAAAAAAATAAQDQSAPKSLGIWPMLLGLAALIAVIVAITSGGNNGSGDLSPISPA